MTNALGAQNDVEHPEAHLEWAHCGNKSKMRLQEDEYEWNVRLQESSSLGPEVAGHMQAAHARLDLTHRIAMYSPDLD
ncbi:hypothetical protein DHEL01_v210476 [Diaporthe helianthi]|uniref:Uncharacterized protein n=1 Tax=Diaporthe helianthi TaxID=158607 RepID=A0A2P5HLJ4_DIAHE|nr:hypothetical protein DHEL01_v210476 [Diaporthe helianthi]